MASAAKKSDDSNVVHLKNGPPEDAVAAVNLAKIQRAKADFESANGSYRSVLKNAEGKGIHLKAAQRAIAIRKSGKTEEMIDELSKLFEYLTILGTPIEKKQLDMFRVEAPRTPSVDKAKELGRYAGIMGHGTEECPHSPDTDAYTAWMEAFHQGSKERELVLSMEPADGSDLIKGDEEDDEQESGED